MTVTVSINSAEQIIKDRGLEKGGPAQKFLDSEVMRLSEPYVPFLSGILKKGIGTVIGTGEIVYNTPYARKQYYENAGRGTQGTVSGGLRGKLWDRRMVADKGEALTRSFAAFIGGKPA